MSEIRHDHGLLGRWYATPLSVAEAERLVAGLQARHQQGLRAGRGCSTCQIGLLIGGFWRGKDIEAAYLNLSRRLQGRRHAQALLELVMGQLLMSRQLEGARGHLARGFELAHGLLCSADYFTLLKRHALLTHIPLSLQPQAPRDLPQLLAMAAVIERLQAAGMPARNSRPSPGEF